MSRYIDADAVKVRYRGGFYDDYVVDYDSFMKAPSIEIPTWIPCRERLPDNYKFTCYLVCDAKGIMAISYYEPYHGRQLRKHLDIVAWMPLPKPYKGADDE